MRNLMKFGIVLVVLTMVTSAAFAGDNDYIGPNPGSWCVAANWSTGSIPQYGDGDKVRLDDDDHVIIDICSPAGCHELEMRGDSILEVGTAVLTVRLDIKKDLEMSDDSTSDFTTLNIVNGDVTVGDQSKDLFEDGSGAISIAAGSSLTFEDGVYFGDSNGDGCGDTYTLDIEGYFAVEGDRLEHRGGHLIINLIGDGHLYVKKTSRLSSKRDAITTVNINTGVGDTGHAVCEFDKVELGEGDKGADCDYSLEINIAGNGTWDGGGEDLKDQDKGQIFNLNVTGNGTFITKKLDINDSDSEINITMDSGTIDITDDLDMEAGDIVITGGEFGVEDDFELGDKGVATITVSGTADVWIDDLYMDGDSELTIDGVSMDVDDLKDVGSIEINGDGELVIKNSDQDKRDEINEWIADGDITTSNGGMVIILEYNSPATLKAVIPVDVDIKPGSDPNPLRVNLQGSGVFPVAIVGSDDFDASTVDKDSVTLDGVAALRAKLGDINQDGTLDLVLKFSRSDLLDALADTHGDLGDLANRAELTLTLSGETTDGDPIWGQDTLVVLNRGGIKAKKK